MKKLSLIAAVLLAGCGSGGDSYTAPPVVVTPAPAAPMMDAFVAQVTTVVASMPEEAEANSIEALVATAPEDSEPISL